MAVDDVVRGQEAWAEDLHEPGGHHQVGSIGRDRLRQGNVPGVAVGEVLNPNDLSWYAGSVGPAQPFDSLPIRGDSDYLSAVRRILAGVEQGLQQRAGATDQDHEAARRHFGHAADLVVKGKGRW